MGIGGDRAAEGEDTPPERVERLLRAALAFHQQGRLTQALAAYAESLALDPGRADVLRMAGVASAQAGRLDQALELMSRAVALSPGDAEAHYNLGNVLGLLDRPEAALASYDAAIALNPAYAEAHANRGGALARLARPDEALAAYDRAVALRPDHAETLSNRGNVLKALGRHGEALASYDKAIALKPGYAEAWSNRGGALALVGRLEAALASYDEAIALRPDFAEAHYNRGAGLQALGRLEEAIASYGRAIGLRPDHAEARCNRGKALRGLGRPAEALADYDAAIAARPDLAEAHSGRGVALRALGRPGEALSAYETAIALRPDLAEARFNRALCLLLMGRFEAGWREHEWRKRKPDPVADRTYPAPPWTGAEDLAGKTLFLHWEQGFGDTIQFCRYARLARARGARVVLSAQAPLTPLLARLEPEVEILGPDQAPAGFDFHAPLMSLPLGFATTADDIPAAPAYLSADPERRAAFAARLGASTKPRIGLAWSGSPGHDNDRDRSIDLARLAPLLTDAAEWICLQDQVRPGDAVALAALGRRAPRRERLDDFGDTAALIALTDLVISVDTAVAHLAGAMGKPVWILLPFAPDWRWMLERGDSPWYPSARLFRQSAIGDWGGVIDQVGAALAARLGRGGARDGGSG